MRQLVALTTILIVVGIGGFMYRNALERPISIGEGAGACTQEAKLCPDGSSVGRAGPNCEFTKCAPPNVSLNTLPSISFAVPAGYTQISEHSEGPAVLAVYEKPSHAADVPHRILITEIGSLGKGVEYDIVSSTVFGPSGETATSIEQLKKVLINGRTFYSVVLERFEGQIESRYYLPPANGNGNLYSFDLIERDVTNWTDPKLVVENLPEHEALVRLLSTLQAD